MPAKCWPGKVSNTGDFVWGVSTSVVLCCSSCAACVTGPGGRWGRCEVGMCADVP